jgi:DNA polymerase-3 subunit alpha
MMAFAQFEDLTGLVELVVFPTVYKDNQKFWETDAMLLVEGKINDKDGSLKILVDRAWPLDVVTPSMLPKIRNGFSASNAKSESQPPGSPPPKDAGKAKGLKTFSVELPYRTTKILISQLKEVLQSHPGSTPVELRILNNGDTKIMQTKLTVKQTPELEEEIEQILSAV